MDQKEKLHVESSVPKEERKTADKPSAAKDISKKASEVMGSRDSAENAEGAEGVELNEGKVSEASSEDKSHAPAGKGKAYTADEIESIRAKLLAALPTQDIMIKQIRKKLMKEEKTLTKRMKKLQKNGHMEAFQLTIVVAQLRKVKEYFSLLAHATYELIKHLWLKIVHGV